MSITKKLKCKKGVTLVELLCVVAVLSILSGMMIMGVNLAMKTYENSVTESESRVLGTTLTTAITDELKNAKDITVSTSGEDVVIEYYSSRHGKNTRLTTDAEGAKGYVLLTGNSEADMYLLAQKSYTHNCTADVDLTYDEAQGLFKVELTILNIHANTMYESSFTVKPVA